MTTAEQYSSELATMHEEIRALASKRDAVILAHNYQVPEVQDVADFVGDSLGLSREAASTDANIPISIGIPAVTVGRGGVTDNQHSASESFDPKNAYLGVQKNLLTALALVGVQGVSEPMLAKRK